MKIKITQMDKGITLIALIITIVVLLILAAVAIASVQNQGIVEHANNAATTYKDKKQEEEGILDSYTETLNKHSESALIPGTCEHSWSNVGIHSFDNITQCSKCGTTCAHSTKTFSRYERLDSEEGYHWSVYSCNDTCRHEVYKKESCNWNYNADFWYCYDCGDYAIDDDLIGDR